MRTRRIHFNVPARFSFLGLHAKPVVLTIVCVLPNWRAMLRIFSAQQQPDTTQGSGECILTSAKLAQVCVSLIIQTFTTHHPCMLVRCVYHLLAKYWILGVIQIIWMNSVSDSLCWLTERCSPVNCASIKEFYGSLAMFCKSRAHLNATQLVQYSHIEMWRRVFSYEQLLMINVPFHCKSGR